MAEAVPDFPTARACWQGSAPVRDDRWWYAWQGRQESNLRHPVLEAGALASELHPFGAAGFPPSPGAGGELWGARVTPPGRGRESLPLPPVPRASSGSPGPDGVPGAAGRREPSSGLGSPHSVSRFVYFVTLIPSNAVDFGARQTNQS